MNGLLMPVLNVFRQLHAWNINIDHYLVHELLHNRVPIITCCSIILPQKVYLLPR